MQPLNFPTYEFRFKNSENGPLIFDCIRRKFVMLQPEEWVRQNVVQYLHVEKKYPISLINVEKQFAVNQLKKRMDVVVFDTKGKVKLLVECKAPNIAINQESFDQIARYNLAFEANYLMVTNGLQHYYCQMDRANEKYIFMRDIPEFTG